MFGKSKRGQSGFNQILWGLVGLFVITSFILAFSNNVTGDFRGFINALPDALGTMSGWFQAIFVPLLGFLLNLGSDPNTNFLMILSFFLAFIVVTGTLDSTDIFGGGNITNLFIGLLVSAVGVRFMPDNLWLSLTAPSSAFVATLLVGAPFVAMFFVSRKFKYSVMGKIAWILYLLVLGYILLGPVQPGTASANSANLLAGSDFVWVYLLFFLLGLAMLIFDNAISGWYKRFTERMIRDKNKADSDLISRSALKKEMSALNKIMGDGTSSNDDKKAAAKRLKELDKIVDSLS